MARYKDAIDWIALNDDTEWVEYDSSQPDGTECISAALVADLFNKTTEQVRADLKQALRRLQSG